MSKQSQEDETDMGPRARRTDPQTSHDAAQVAWKSYDKRRKAILRVLINAGEPLAAEQIADRSGGVFRDHVPVNRRLTGLERDGTIEKTGGKYINRESGCEAHRYAITPVGRERFLSAIDDD